VEEVQLHDRPVAVTAERLPFTFVFEPTRRLAREQHAGVVCEERDCAHTRTASTPTRHELADPPPLSSDPTQHQVSDLLAWATKLADDAERGLAEDRRARESLDRRWIADAADRQREAAAKEKEYGELKRRKLEYDAARDSAWQTWLGTCHEAKRLRLAREDRESRAKAHRARALQLEKEKRDVERLARSRPRVEQVGCSRLPGRHCIISPTPFKAKYTERARALHSQIESERREAARLDTAARESARLESLAEEQRRAAEEAYKRCVEAVSEAATKAEAARRRARPEKEKEKIMCLA
jgi:hypothetical protein